MFRALFVGDLTADPTRRARAVELMQHCSLYGVEALDATVKLLARVGDVPVGTTAANAAAWRLSETMHHLEPMAFSHPNLIVGFDPLAVALASRAFPGTLWVLHVDGMGAGLPQLSLEHVTKLPGLHEVLTAVLRGASFVLVNNPRNAATLQREWGVSAERLHHCPLEAGTAGPLYLDAAMAPTQQAPTKFHWWTDLWHARPTATARLA